MGCACSNCRSTFKGPDIRDEYKIGHVLGSGSFGQVRLCVSKKTNQHFAVKIMSREPPKEKKGTCHVDFASMFSNEQAILKQLNHPHIIKLRGFYEDRNYFYSVMDKCEGGELFAQIVKKRRFEEVDSASLCCQMLSAIEFVHSKGFVHRDIKAENFLFSGCSLKSNLILIDFGMSTKVPEGKQLHQLCGSPHYVAPELIDKKYGFEVDMWALGVVIYLMIYGKYPFEGSDQNGIVNAIQKQEPEYRNRNGIPSELAMDFMRRLLEKDPKKRLSATAAWKHDWIQNSLNAQKQKNATTADATNGATTTNVDVATTTNVDAATTRKSSITGSQKSFRNSIRRSRRNSQLLKELSAVKKSDVSIKHRHNEMLQKQPVVN